MALFSIGLENGDENRSIAFFLDHPGCFAYGPDPETAMQAVPEAIRAYAAWIERHAGQSWLAADEPIEVRLEESWQVYVIDENFDLAEQGYAVNAWFRHDWKLLTAAEIERSLTLLSWSRADLLETARGLGQEILDRQYPNERWSIAGILRHVAGAEWWYLDRLGLAFPWEQLAKDTFERLDQVRSYLRRVLPGLAGSRQVVGVDGEFWSPRKLLRRAIWHERDHTEHIRKLLG